MSTPERLLGARRGVVVAPAGCGKTRLLVDTVVSASGRTLVLTHTRAGVAVIRSRLSDRRIKAAQCRVATLDNWCGWLASRLPNLSGYVPTRTPADYRLAQLGAEQALASSAVQAALTATYDRVFVDEYQDCSGLQHDIVLSLAASVPVVAFGDPMQRIFDFNGSNPPKWADVLAAYDKIWTLDVPWRWHNAGERDFGDWVLKQRAVLQAGGKVDFRAAPPNVTWVQLPNDATQHRQHNLSAIPRTAIGTSLFVLNDSKMKNERQEIARQGIRLSVVESADMPDLLNWAQRLERASGKRMIEEAIEFAAVVMTGIDKSALVDRISVLHQSSGQEVISEEEKMLMGLKGNPAGLGSVIERMARGRTVYRPELLDAICKTCLLVGKDTTRTFTEAAAIVRVERGAEGRRVSARAIGSTLLLKGLEADHTVILDADSMTRANLYVAISRGSRRLTVVSKSAVLPAV